MSSPLNFNYSTPPGTPEFHQLTTWLHTHTYTLNTHWSRISHAHMSLQTRATAWVLSWILLRLLSITAGPMNDLAVSCASVCVCVYIHGEERWVSSHVVCLKCVSSTSYREQPWKCSCRAVSLSFCHGGSRHAPWPRCPRHLPRETGEGGNGWTERGRGGCKETKRKIFKK